MRSFFIAAIRRTNPHAKELPNFNKFPGKPSAFNELADQFTGKHNRIYELRDPPGKREICPRSGEELGATPLNLNKFPGKPSSFNEVDDQLQENATESMTWEIKSQN